MTIYKHDKRTQGHKVQLKWTKIMKIASYTNNSRKKALVIAHKILKRSIYKCIQITKRLRRKNAKLLQKNGTINWYRSLLHAEGL